MEALIKVYVLGLHLKHSAFCQAVIEALLETAEDASIYHGPVTIADAYKNTRKGSVLRHVMVQLHVQCGREE
jgi:hypothetical protein